jgi:hypothetical protein
LRDRLRIPLVLSSVAQFFVAELDAVCPTIYFCPNYPPTFPLRIADIRPMVMFIFSFLTAIDE